MQKLFLTREVQARSKKMCINSEEWRPIQSFPCSDRSHRSTRHKVRVYGLMRRCEQKLESDIEQKNWKLYLENRSIIEENEKLRQRANLLYQENLALKSELQKKFNPTAHAAPAASPVVTETGIKKQPSVKI